MYPVFVGVGNVVLLFEIIKSPLLKVPPLPDSDISYFLVLNFDELVVCDVKKAYVKLIEHINDNIIAIKIPF